MLPTALRRKLLLLLVPPLWAAYTLSIVDRTNLAVAQLGGANNTAPHGMGQPPQYGGLGLSQAQFGLAAGVFFAGYSTAQVPVLQILVHLGARRVLGLCTLLTGLCSAATAFVGGLGSLCAVRLVLGVFEAGMYPGALYFISTWFPNEYLGQASSLFVTGAAVGPVLGGGVSGLAMAALDGDDGWPGWRWLFIIQGVPTMAIGLLLLLVLPDAPHSCRMLNGDERRALSAALRSSRAHASGKTEAEEAAGETLIAAVAADSDDDDAEAAPLPLGAALCRVVRTPVAWLFALQHFVGALLAYTIIFFLPKQLREIFPPDTPLYAVGTAAAVPGFISALIAPVVARAVDDFDEPRRTRGRYILTWGFPALATAFLVSAGGILLAAAARDEPPAASGAPSPSAVLAIGLVGLCAGTIFFAAGPFWALHHSVIPAEVRHTSVAFVNSVGNVGGFVGPYVLGWLHDRMGPSCPASEAARGCTREWAWGLTVLGGGTFVLTLLLGAAAARALLPPSRAPPIN